MLKSREQFVFEVSELLQWFFDSAETLKGQKGEVEGLNVLCNEFVCYLNRAKCNKIRQKNDCLVIEINEIITLYIEAKGEITKEFFETFRTKIENFADSVFSENQSEA